MLNLKNSREVKTKIEPVHSWRITPAKAVQIQKKLAEKVIIANRIGRLQIVGGVDVAFPSGTGMAVAVVVAMNWGSLDVVETSISCLPVKFPYIPGLLAFREGEVIVDALNKLQCLPDILIFDGQGIAHPRRLGIATHIGLLANIPSIGCAKSLLWGRGEQPKNEKGAFTHLMNDDGSVIGAILRTRKGVKPVYISPGHLIDVDKAVKIIMDCVRQYRLPEPIRKAHQLAGIKREFNGDSYLDGS